MMVIKKKKVMENIRNLLIKKGFKIQMYAPNESFMFTQLKSHNWGTGERIIGLIVQIEDKITFNGSWENGRSGKWYR